MFAEMGILSMGMHCSQNLFFKCLLLIGCLVTLTLAQVMTPQIAKEILLKHNEYRRQESASNMYLLHWNVSLQERADSWAQKCLFKHERNLDLGENLFFDTDHENDVFERGMGAWHKEKSNWGYTSNSCTRACHFTQLVWGYTTTVGCSANVCPSLSVGGKSIKDAMLFVCYYYPRGNFIGNFPYAKGRPCSECASGDTCSNGLCISSGPISKLAPDFVKSLMPLGPTNLSRSRYSFQDFKSLIQQFSSETSQAGQHQSVHHRSEHHHSQQHHFQSQSQSVVSAGSQSNSYSQHSRAQQHHQQVYQSSQSQTHHQQRNNGERTEISQSQTHHLHRHHSERTEISQSQTHHQQRHNGERTEISQSQTQHQQRLHGERTEISQRQTYHQQRQNGDTIHGKTERDKIRQEDKRPEDIIKQEHHKQLEAQNSNQHHYQQQQQIERNERLKEQDRLQQQVEENRRRDLKQQEELKRIELENRQLALMEEQKRQEELEQRRQHALLQRRFQEEKTHMERLQREEDERQRLLKHKEIQIENEKIRRQDLEQSKQTQELGIDAHRRRQSTDYNMNQISISRKEPNEDRKSQTAIIPPRQPAETFRPPASVYGRSLNGRSHLSTDYVMSTIGLDLRNLNHNNRYDIDDINTNYIDQSKNEESNISRIRNQNRFPSKAQEIIKHQSTTPSYGLKLLPVEQTDKTYRTQISPRGYEVVSIPNWLDQRRETNTQAYEGTRGLSQSLRDSRGNSNIEDGRTNKEAALDNESETDISVGDVVSEDGLSSLQRQKQVEDNRRRQMDKQLVYRSKVVKKVEGKHPHMENFVMDASGRRCVDRHVECVRWAPKCYKSSAVTLACPMTCGKCGLHVNTEPELAEQTEKLELALRVDPVGDREMKKKNRQGDMPLSEKKAKILQRRRKQDKNGQPTPMEHPGAEQINQKKTPRRTKEQRMRIREQRKRERQRKQEATQERQSLCRDDPKHIKSCKYWAKKGFCVENKLIQNIYCQLSCGKCE